MRMLAERLLGDGGIRRGGGEERRRQRPRENGRLLAQSPAVGDRCLRGTNRCGEGSGSVGAEVCR
jgi:hypothetical protein